MIPIVLSGGSGTRLWPLSRTQSPKQFCHFFEKTLQEMTLVRLMTLSTPWIVTNAGLKDRTQLQMQNLKLPFSQLVLEPKGRNTAPAIALICRILQVKGQEQEVAGIFPADHLIEDENAFMKALNIAEAAAREGKLVTLGIQPDFPSTGYGYIQVAASGKDGARAVQRFHEKPDLATAEKFVASGQYFWNAGIFIFKIQQMIEHLKTHQPRLWALMTELKADLSNLTDIYERIEPISIDYAILEKLGPESLACVPCQIGWSDIGSWDAIADIMAKKPTDLVQAHGKGNFVHPLPDKVYAFGGVDDLIVVDSKDAMMITRRGQSQSVKEIVDQLKERKTQVLKQHVDEERPWGGFEVLKDTDFFKSKVVIVNPGQQISYQSHNQREEHWLIVQGTGEVILDGKTLPVQPGTYVKIPLQAKHRIRNTGDKVMKFVEVQLGSYFGEDDIIRYQDDYLRE